MLTAKNAKMRADRIKKEKALRREKVLDEMQKRTIEFCDNQLTSDILDSIDRGDNKYCITLACGFSKTMSVHSVIPTTDIFQEYTEEQWINEGLMFYILQTYLKENGYKVTLSEENMYSACYITISWD